MRKILLVSVSALLLVGCAGNGGNQTATKFKEVCDKVKADNIPDKRVQVFDPVLDDKGEALVLRGVTTNTAAKEQLLKGMADAGIKALDSLEVLPAAAMGEKIYGVTTLSVINFRTGPGYDAEAATQTMMGAPLKLLMETDGWVRAVTPEGYIAWVRGTGIAKMTKEEFDSYTAAPKVVVTDKYISVMETPGGKNPVSDAVWGDVMLDLGVQGSYRAVSLPDGRKGFVSNSSVMDYTKWINSRNATAETIIETARQFMGVPYMWGATSIKAVDCSGFTKSVYYLNGIILARDASQQCYTGEDVDITKYVNDSLYTMDALQNLKKGDLVFFGRKATAEKKERITHVGIYIENGQFIHSAGFVHINSLLPNEEDYYSGSTRLVRAQRILGNEDKGMGIETIKNSVYGMPQQTK